MMMRIWHDDRIVAELDIPDVFDGNPGWIAWFPKQSPIVGDRDHVIIEPWAKLAGEQVKGKNHAVSIALYFPQHGAGEEHDDGATARSTGRRSVQP
jgi:hypothetical protein